MAKSQTVVDTEIRKLSTDQRKAAFSKFRSSFKNEDHKMLHSDQVEETIPYGLVGLDHACRLGGMPRRGRVIHINGPEHSCKSTLGYSILHNYQIQTGGEPVAIHDFERTLNNEYLDAVGFDRENALVYFPDSIEEACKLTIQMLQLGVRIFMFDSIPRMKNRVATKDILSGKAFKDTVGVHARAIQLFFDTMLPHAAAADATFLVINQNRARIENSMEAQTASKYGSTFWNLDYTLPGGRSVRYVPSVMLETKIRKAYRPLTPENAASDPELTWLIEPAENTKTKEPFCAVKIAVRVLKNKVNAGGYRESNLWNRPGMGFDDNISVRELARQYNLIFSAGGKKWFVGESQDNAIATYNTRAEAVQDLVINQNPNVLLPLRELVVKRASMDSSFDTQMDAATQTYMAGEVDTPLDEVEAPATGAFEVEDDEL